MDPEVMIGMIVWYKDDLGFVRPGIVLRVWDRQTVNLLVLYDGSFAPDRPDMQDMVFKQSMIKRGRDNGQWDFMGILEYEVEE